MKRRREQRAEELHQRLSSELGAAEEAESEVEQPQEKRPRVASDPSVPLPLRRMNAQSFESA